MFTILFRLVHLKSVVVGCVSADLSMSHCPGARRGDSGPLVCVGAGGLGSCWSSVLLFALNCGTEALQLANNGLSECVTLSPSFLNMLVPNGNALRQHLV